MSPHLVRDSSDCALENMNAVNRNGLVDYKSRPQVPQVVQTDYFPFDVHFRYVRKVILHNPEFPFAALKGSAPPEMLASTMRSIPFQKPSDGPLSVRHLIRQQDFHESVLFTFGRRPRVIATGLVNLAVSADKGPRPGN